MNISTTKLLILATLSIFTGCKSPTKENTMPPIKVQTATSEVQLSSDMIVFSSSMEPLYSATIEPRVNGYLQNINYKSGTHIKSGQVIFTIDPSLLNTTYYAALASLESAKASFIEAQNNYNRAVPLAQINAISMSDLDGYTATYAAAKSNVKSAEEALKNAELNSSYSVLKAPIDGVIAETPASVGDYVGPGTNFTTLTTISYIDTMIVALAIPTAKYLQYTQQLDSYDNQKLLDNITIILADSSEYNHKASYDYTQKDISAQSSTVVIYAKVANSDGVLKPNMFTRVKANIGGEHERIMVPQKAVTQIQGISSVWVIEPDSTATFRLVELGNTYGQNWHIKSGLNAGERVATSSQLKIHEGAKVIPIAEK